MSCSKGNTEKKKRMGAMMKKYMKNLEDAKTIMRHEQGESRGINR